MVSSRRDDRAARNVFEAAQDQGRRVYSRSAECEAQDEVRVLVLLPLRFHIYTARRVARKRHVRLCALPDDSLDLLERLVTRLSGLDVGQHCEEGRDLVCKAKRDD